MKKCIILHKSRLILYWNHQRTWEGDVLEMNNANRFSGKSGRITLLLLIILTFALLCLPGCGSKSAQENQSQKTGNYSSQADTAAPLTKYGDGKSTSQITELDRKVIQNAEISLKVQDVTAAADKIIDLNQTSGGYTVNSHIYRNGEQISADLSLKIPQQKLTGFITNIAAIGEVTDKRVSTEDVTEEYYDAEARLKVMRAKEERLLGLLNKASSITDIISIENELGQTRSEIEVLTGRLKYLTNAVDYSMVHINLSQAIPGAIKTPQGTMGKAVQGLISSLNNMINFGSNLIVALFVGLPWLLLIIILVLVFRYFYNKKKK